MKEKIKLMGIIAAVAIIGVSLASCGEDIDVTGTWVATVTTAEYLNIVEEDESFLEMAGITGYTVDLAKFTFRNGNYNLVTISPYDRSEVPIDSGAYTVKGSKITIQISGVEESFTVSGNTFSIEVDGIDMTFKKQ